MSTKTITLKDALDELHKSKLDIQVSFRELSDRKTSCGHDKTLPDILIQHSILIEKLFIQSLWQSLLIKHILKELDHVN